MDLVLAHTIGICDITTKLSLYQVVVMAIAHIAFVCKLNKCIVSHETMSHTRIFPQPSPVTKCLSLDAKHTAVTAS